MSLPPLPRRPLLPAAALLLAALFAFGCYQPAAPTEAAEEARGDYLFCFWNAENFFDDKVNGWKTHPDKEYDTWFARDGGQVFRHKLANLTEVLSSLNDGKGPDILALAEVETERAAELLLESLNQAVGRKAAPYQHLLMKNPHGGRNIATAILTRLPVEKDRTQLLGRRQRILEGHITVNGHDLVVIASHWTSRLREPEGKVGRAHYADAIYGRFRAMYKSNPDVAVLVCGDFNDNPDDESVVKHLHATGDLDLVGQGGEGPHLYNLFAKRWERNNNESGTHFHRGKWFIFDQIVISPGMLKKRGWYWDEDYPAQIVRKIADPKGRPLPFGNEKDKRRRGASDHFPVTVRLKVAGAPR
jgi:endonuclease/exonuclease/phosphatase family metal-dependent hydrolase